MIRKLTLFIAAITLLVQASASAADCKYDRNEFDRFTKQKIVETDSERLTTGAHFFAAFSAYASVRAKGDETYLDLKIARSEREKYPPRNYQLNNRFVITPGSSLLLLMADGSIVELRTAKGRRISATYTDPDAEFVDEFQIESAGEIEYMLDEAAIAALSAQDVTNLRIAGVEKYTNAYDTHFDVAVREKMTGSIRNAVGCTR